MGAWRGVASAGSKKAEQRTGRARAGGAPREAATGRAEAGVVGVDEVDFVWFRRSASAFQWFGIVWSRRSGRREFLSGCTGAGVVEEAGVRWLDQPNGQVTTHWWMTSS